MRVEIFIPPTSCQCGAHPTPARQEKIGRALALCRYLQGIETIDLEVCDLGDDVACSDGMRRLSALLREAGESELSARAAYAMNEITPSVAVDGKLVCIKDCPTSDAFDEEYRDV